MEEIDWLDVMSRNYNHPALILWKSLESRAISSVLDVFHIQSPTLDIGCGDGKLSKMIFEGGINIGLDLSPELLYESRVNSAFEYYIIADTQYLPFRANSIRFINSIGVLHTIPDILKVLTEINTILLSGGTLCIAQPSDRFKEYLFFSPLKKIGLKRIYLKYSEWRCNKLRNFHCYDLNKVNNLFKKTNFKMIAQQNYISKSSVWIWDFFSIIIYITKITQIISGHTRAYNIILNKTIKTLKPIIKKILRKYFNDQKNTEGAFLIISEKK